MRGSVRTLGKSRPHMSTGLWWKSCPGTPWHSWHSSEREDFCKTRSLWLLLLPVSGNFSQLCSPFSLFHIQKWHYAVTVHSFAPTKLLVVKKRNLWSRQMKAEQQSPLLRPTGAWLTTSAHLAGVQALVHHSRTALLPFCLELENSKYHSSDPVFRRMKVYLEQRRAAYQAALYYLSLCGHEYVIWDLYLISYS